MTVRIDNPVGAISITVSATGKFDLKPSSSQRELRDGDVQVSRGPGLLVIECKPHDKAPIDIELTIPYGALVQARTSSGKIKFQGIVPRADLVTESGDLELRSVWEAMRLQVTAETPPKEFTPVPALKLRQNHADQQDQPAWVLTDKNPLGRVIFGRILAKVGRPGRIDISDMPFPEDAPFRLHWQAPEVVDRLLSAPRQRFGRPRTRPVRTKTLDGDTPVVSVDSEEVLFTSDVRIVNIPVAVYDSAGHPLIGLGKDDFEILENGVAQEMAFLAAGDASFNLVLLLDLSGSTRQNRAAMKQTARRFIEIAGPEDRVAAYALARNMLHVVSSLTADRETLAKQIEALPEVSGGTPLYDAVALAYAQELSQLDSGRNALIVISDGIDNDLYGQLTPSKLSFQRLERAAREMNALIYPVLLDPAEGQSKTPRWARKARRRMERLAAATGGRLFPAASLDDLEPVYRQVAAELRSVYSLAYYPRDQDFDGEWRDVAVKSKQPGARLRFRNGYFSR